MSSIFKSGSRASKLRHLTNVITFLLDPLPPRICLGWQPKNARLLPIQTESHTKVVKEEA